MRGIFFALIFAAFSAAAQDSPYQPDVGNSNYSSGFSKADESAMYDLRRRNWQDNNRIRQNISGGNSSYYGGGNLRTPTPPPTVHHWTDYGKGDAWRKANTKDDEKVCQLAFNEVQRIHASVDGYAYQKANRGRADYHTYVGLITEAGERIRSHEWKIRRYAATGTAQQCVDERDAAERVANEMIVKIKHHEKEFSNLRQLP